MLHAEKRDNPETLQLFKIHIEPLNSNSTKYLRKLNLKEILLKRIAIKSLYRSPKIVKGQNMLFAWFYITSINCLRIFYNVCRFFQNIVLLSVMLKSFLRAMNRFREKKRNNIFNFFKIKSRLETAKELNQMRERSYLYKKCRIKAKHCILNEIQ